MPLLIFLDHSDLFKRFPKFLFIIVMNNDSIKLLNHFCVFYAFVNATVTLENLENGFLIDFGLVIFKKLPKSHHLLLPFYLKLVFYGVIFISIFHSRLDVVYLIQFEFNDPCTK